MKGDTLGNLTPGDRLYVACAPCGRQLTLDVATLIERLGPSHDVNGAMGKAVCRQCGLRMKAWRGYDPIAENGLGPVGGQR